jgi:Uma2 family endonuclease
MTDLLRQNGQTEEGAPEPRRWSREAYIRMAELGLIGPDERVELIDGEILQMSPQKNLHVAATTLAADSCRRLFSSGYWVRVQATLSIVDCMPEPDVAVVAGEMAAHGEDYPEAAVLVIEVSDTTLPYDRGRKASLYAAAGIPDYWIVNLVDGMLEVRRSPVEVPSAPFGCEYSTVTLLRRSETVAPLEAPAATLTVESLFPG